MSVVNCVDKNYESKIHVHIPFVLLSQELYRQRTVVSMVFFLRFEQVFKYMHSALFCAFPVLGSDQSLSLGGLSARSSNPRRPLKGNDRKQRFL